MPVIPATQEAEAGEVLQPGRQRYWRAEIVPLHSSLSDKSETPSQKNKKDMEEHELLTNWISRPASELCALRKTDMSMENCNYTLKNTPLDEKNTAYLEE